MGDRPRSRSRDRDDSRQLVKKTALLHPSKEDIEEWRRLVGDVATSGPSLSRPPGLLNKWAAAHKEVHGTDESRPGSLSQHQKDTYTSFAIPHEHVCLLCFKKFGDDGRDLEDHETLSPEHLHNLTDPEKVGRACDRLKAVGETPHPKTRRGQVYPGGRSYISYADRETLICHLGDRVFKTAAALRVHERESALHSTSSEAVEILEKATHKLKKVGKTPTRMHPVPPPGQDKPAYRDRAEERRAMFNQPAKPTMAGGAGKRGHEDGGRLAGDERKEKRARVSEGPQEPHFYVRGMGLGAEGSKGGSAAEEAARRTRAVEDSQVWVEEAKQKARDRYEALAKE